MFPVGLPYGSYLLPSHYGSGGGGVSPGRGGGFIKLNISQGLHLDGFIYTTGGAAGAGDSGGGSGGSVYVVATNFSGHGNVSVEGGTGSGLGHGGSGGRMGIKVLWLREFSGSYLAYGGRGGPLRDVADPGNAAGGTVYYTDSSKGLTSKEVINTTHGLVFRDSFQKLLLDNDNRNGVLPTVIEAESTSYFEFDEVEAHNHVVLQMAGNVTVTMVVHKFKGDRTGLFHLLPDQKMYVEYVASKVGYTIAPVSYKIEQGAEIIMPSTVTMLGTRTEVHGRLVNIHNLTIAEGAQTSFYSTAQTALLEDGVYSHLTQPGNVTFASITIQRGSVLEMTHILNTLTLHIDTFRLKYEGLILMNRGSINSDTAVIESEGLLSLNYTGHGPDTGPGAGFTTSTGLGTGAAHGGHGGAPNPQTGGMH